MTNLHHHDTIQTQEFDLEFYHNLLGIEWDCQDDHAEATDAAYPVDAFSDDAPNAECEYVKRIIDATRLNNKVLGQKLH